MRASTWHTLGDLVACLYDALAPALGAELASATVALLVEHGVTVGDVS